MSYRTSLDWLNFLLADVRGGLGPYVNVFLLTEAGWDQAKIGIILTISGLIGIAFHAPVGALIDAARSKRALLIAGIWLLAICAIAIPLAPTAPVVIVADVTMAILGAVFAPTVAAITLGMVGRDRLAWHVGRNAAFDRTGNLFIAALAAGVGAWYGQRAIFFLVPFFAVFATLATLSISAQSIDHERARGLEEDDDAHAEPVAWSSLFRRRPFLVLAAGAALFHFANAPMLALASQKLALGARGWETATTSAAIIVAQLATIPMALIVTRANWIGRKPMLLLAFAAVPLRGLLFASFDDPVLIIAFQILDGVGAGLFDAILPLVLADVVQGTGRYNASRGVIGAIQGVGGASSYAFAGVIVAYAGYSVAFLAATGVGIAALLLILFAMPETARMSPRQAARA